MTSGRHGRLTDGRKLEKCGTPGGYMRHYRRSEEACALCKKAHSAYEVWRRKTTAEERIRWTIRVRERKVTDND